MESKVCKKCAKELVLSEFSNHKFYEDGKDIACKGCRNKKPKAIKSFIYILIYPDFEGWIKLGRTTNLVQRLNGYNTSTPHRNFEYYYFQEVNDVYTVELKFNDIVKSKYEWFNIGAPEAKDILLRILKP
jgi:hypothetical protein